VCAQLRRRGIFVFLVVVDSGGCEKFFFDMCSPCSNFQFAIKTTFRKSVNLTVTTGLMLVMMGISWHKTAMKTGPVFLIFFDAGTR